MTDELPAEKTGETKESKSDVMHQLQAQGLWDEASVYRTERRIQYRNAGLTKKEAGDKAWDDMRLKYPPPGVDPVEPPDIEIAEPDPEPEEDIVHIAATKGSMNVARDVEWAYNNLNDKHVRADQAPSAGAWNMLIYGREARHKFIELVARYDSQKQKEQKKEAEEYGKDTADHIKALQKLRSITKKVHRDAIRDAIRQAPDEVERVLRSAGWDVTRPAEEPLESAGIGT